jgi:Xaa-Pro aminopeptidase
MKYIISKREVEKRVSEIGKSMDKTGMDALYLASKANISYLTNFFFIPTERPIAAIVKSNGEKILIVPRLEVEHAEKYSYADKILWYPEYPDEKHPMKWISEYIEGEGLSRGKIGYDVDGYGHVFGYRGKRLSEYLPNTKFRYARDLVEQARLIKSHEEIVLLRESSRWTKYVHQLLQEYSRPGISEDEVEHRASLEATLKMAEALRDKYLAVGWIVGAKAGFRGQIGIHSYYPHSLPRHTILREGDILVTGAGASVSGYSVELERTMFLGKPSGEASKYFDLMLRAQEIALDHLSPGTKCSDVDKAVRKFYREKGLYDYWRHHTGHGIGLDYHEAPFLDVGDDTILVEGMVLTIEPGIYVPGLGGFRHSDTVLITGDGYEFLTDYPRDIDDLTIL